MLWTPLLGKNWCATMQTYNWYSVPKQVESVRKLLQYDFLHICPGDYLSDAGLSCQTAFGCFQGSLDVCNVADTMILQIYPHLALRLGASQSSMLRQCRQ